MQASVSRQSLVKNGLASRYLDLLRGIAAMYVLVFHFRATMYVGNHGLKHHSLVVTGVYFLSSLGYQFVMVFFVLSGFLISSTIVRMLDNERWSWRNYLTSRLTRLWIVLIPAMFLTSIWGMIDGYGRGHLGIGAGLANILFLQGVRIDNYGFNGPLWSLSFEFWYYILFPCILLAFRSKNGIAKMGYGIATVLLGAALTLIVGKLLVMYFFIWLFGAALAFFPSPSKKGNGTWAIWGSVGLSVVCLCIGEYMNNKDRMNSDLFRQYPFNIMVGIAFALLILVLLRYKNMQTERSVKWRFPVLLSSFSYTLYLVHWPVIMLLKSRLDKQGWNPDLRHLGFGILMCLGISVYAWAISLVTERHTDKARRFVERIGLSIRAVRTENIAD